MKFNDSQEGDMVTVVNELDEAIGVKDRIKLDYTKDIYRVSALWVMDHEGNILLAQRGLEKRHHPGLFGPAVAGTVDVGETYEENILKEAQEELGLSDIEPVPLYKSFHESEYKHFTQWFLCVVDRNIDLVLEEGEVASVEWFSQDNLEKELLEKPEKFLPSLQDTFPKISEFLAGMEK